MTTAIDVRPMAEHDLAAVCAIVNHYIATSTTNFRDRPQTERDWSEDRTRHRSRYPWLVAETGGAVVGLAYAAPWKPREAYGWCCEATVYVRAGAHRSGIGSALYRELLRILDAQGFTSVVGVVALPNDASVRLHERCGFHRAGTLRSVGHKLGRWTDVAFYQRVVADLPDPPSPPLPVAAADGAKPR